MRPRFEVIRADGVARSPLDPITAAPTSKSVLPVDSHDPLVHCSDWISKRRASLARSTTWTVASPGFPTIPAVRYPEPKEMSPMTVRWKPLMILSGLFVIIALVGVIAMAYTLVPRRAAD